MKTIINKIKNYIDAKLPMIIGSMWLITIILFSFGMMVSAILWVLKLLGGM